MLGSLAIEGVGATKEEISGITTTLLKADKDATAMVWLTKIRVPSAIAIEFSQRNTIEVSQQMAPLERIASSTESSEEVGVLAGGRHRVVEGLAIQERLTKKGSRNPEWLP